MNEDRGEDQQLGTSSAGNLCSVIGNVSAISRLVGDLPKCPIIVVRRGQVAVSPRQEAMYLLLESGEPSPLQEGYLHEFDKLHLLAPGTWSVDPPSISYSECVCSDSNGKFFGMFNARELNQLLSAGHPTFDVFADMLNLNDENRIENIPGFISSEDAIPEDYDNLKTLEKMNSADSEYLPAIDNMSQFKGILERSKLNASFIVDITNKLEPK